MVAKAHDLVLKDSRNMGYNLEKTKLVARNLVWVSNDNIRNIYSGSF